MANLPSGYTQLTYIKKNSNKHYIDTGYRATANTSVDIQYSYEGNQTGSNHICSSPNFYVPFPKGGSHFLSNRKGAEKVIGMSVYQGQIYTVKAFFNDTVEINGTVYEGFTCGSSNPSMNLYLFTYSGSPSSYNNKISIYYCKIYESGTLVRDFVPCINDNGVVGMYDTVNSVFYGNTGTGTFVAGEEVVPLTIAKYLIKSDNKLYTVVDGALSELAITDIVAQTFLDYGVDEIPDGELLVGLDNLEVLCWRDGEDDLPTLTAIVTATPPYQIIMSRAIDLMHSSIKGIDSITVDCKGDVLFAVSFDNKATWIKHNGTDWVNVADELTGMTKLEFEAITTEQWQTKYELSSDMYIRCTLTDATQSVTSVNISFIN